ncbi:hypothetical protein FRC75_21165 [Paracidovorax citrulli]|nr:hypothetical protein FRC75_21165 [Paracidovorax citrulli]
MTPQPLGFWGPHGVERFPRSALDLPLAGQWMYADADEASRQSYLVQNRHFRQWRALMKLSALKNVPCIVWCLALAAPTPGPESHNSCPAASASLQVARNGGISSHFLLQALIIRQRPPPAGAPPPCPPSPPSPPPACAPRSCSWTPRRTTWPT